MTMNTKVTLPNPNLAPAAITDNYRAYQGLGLTAIAMAAFVAFIGGVHMVNYASVWGFLALAVSVVAVILGLAAMCSQPKHEPLAGFGHGTLKRLPFARWVAISPTGEEIPAGELHTMTRDLTRVANWRCLRGMYVFLAFLAVCVGGLLLVPTGALG